MAPSAAANEAEPGDRTLSWLDEDDPARDSEPFIPMTPPPLPPPTEPPPPEPPPVGPAPTRRSRKLLAVVVGLVAVVVAAAAVAAGTAYRLVFEDRPAAPTAGGRSASAPIGQRTEAAFDLVTGTTTVNLRGADLGGDLYRISTAQGSDVLPRPVHEGNRVTLHLVPSGESGPGAVDIQLSTRVTWQLRLTGGAVTHVVDMAGARLTGLDLIGGAARAELTLPRPAGTVPIRMTGGVNQFLIHAPAGVPSRVRVGSGAATVALDEFNRSGVAPGTVFTPNGWAEATSRYDIDAAAGASTIRLDRTP